MQTAINTETPGGHHRPFFSIIVCVYNRELLVTRALDSLLRQTERDWEAIVVDDGSTDNTVRVVQSYALADTRIKIVQRPNGGVAAARNSGIDASTGLFVGFLDSDDEYMDHRLEVLRRALLDNPGVEFLHETAEVIGNRYVPDMNDPTQLIDIADCVVGGTFIIRRDVFEEIGMFDVGAYADDALLYQRALDHGIVVGKSETPTYLYYRDTPDSICSNYSES